MMLVRGITTNHVRERETYQPRRGEARPLPRALAMFRCVLNMKRKRRGRPRWSNPKRSSHQCHELENSYLQTGEDPTQNHKHRLKGHKGVNHALHHAHSIPNNALHQSLPIYRINMQLTHIHEFIMLYPFTYP